MSPEGMFERGCTARFPLVLAEMFARLLEEEPKVERVSNVRVKVFD
jgi:hypothetical protein